MELRHLRYLVAIADAGTFVAAAERLRIAQPALSRQIRTLEGELDVELFEEGARKATLTAAGDACVRIARRVIQGAEAAVFRARLSNTGLGGRCVLSAGPYPITTGFVARAIARIKARLPNVELEITEESQHEQWRALAEARVDIGLGIAAPNEYAMLSQETQVVDIVNTAFVAPAHSLARRKAVSLKELRPHTMLLLAMEGGDDLRERVFAAIAKAGYPMANVKAVPGFDALFGAIAAGQGWGLMPSGLASRMPPAIGLTIKDFGFPLRVVRMWRRADPRPVVLRVLNELRLMQADERDGGAMRGADAEADASFFPPRLELRHLRTFAMVAKHGSLGRAAQLLEITQPALSRQMRELEYDVGVALLSRGTRGMHMTAVGEEFRGDVQDVLAAADHLRKEVRRALRGTQNRCEIGMVPHRSVVQIIGKATANLERSHPEVTLYSTSLPSPRQTEALRRSEVDIVIGFKWPYALLTDGLIRRPLFDDLICSALLAESHPLAKAKSLSLKDLTDVPFLFGTRAFLPRFYDTVMQAFAAAGYQPRIEATFDRLMTLWSMTAQGAGWSLGWHSQYASPPAGVRAVPLTDLKLGWGAEIVYREDERRAPVMAAINAIVHSAEEFRDVAKASIPKKQ